MKHNSPKPVSTAGKSNCRRRDGSQKKPKAFSNPKVKASRNTPTADQTLESFKRLLDDLTGEGLIASQLSKDLTKRVGKMIYSMYDYINTCSGDDWMMQFQSKVKEQFRLLEGLDASFSSAIAMGTNFEVLLYQSDGELTELDDRKWYLPEDFAIIISMMEDENLSIFKNAYKFINHAILALVSIYCSTDSTYDSATRKILTSFILSTIQVFQLLNYSEDQKYVYLLQQIEAMSTKNPNRLLEDEEFLNTWNIFKQDFYEGKKPYIRDLSYAYQQSKSMIESPFDPEQDVYISPHASSSTSENWYIEFTEHGRKQRKKLPSYLAAIFECDHWKNNPIIKSFDDKISYRSPYREEELEGCCTLGQLVLVIDNPAKYKPRIIHVTNNPIMDRLSYMRRRIKYFNSFNRADLIDDQYKMISGIAMVGTTKSNVEEFHWNQYNWDYESATDNGNTDFEYECLSLIFPKEYCDLWRWMSTMTQKAQDPRSGDHEMIEFTQQSGQPQGAIFSMDCFSFCHTIVNRLTILLAKMHPKSVDIMSADRRICAAYGDLSPLARIRPEYFYSTVGDDNVQNTLVEDIILDDSYIDYDNQDWSEQAPPPGFRTVIEISHRKSSGWAGYKINDDKSIFNEYCPAKPVQSSYRAEAIHLVVIDGIVVSPIPPRLILYYSRFDRAVASFNWAIKNGYPPEVFRKLFSCVINRRISELAGNKSYTEDDLTTFRLIMYTLIFGDIIPLYHSLRCERFVEIDPRIKSAIILYYSQEILRTSILYSFYRDNVTAESENPDSWDMTVEEEFNLLKKMTSDIHDGQSLIQLAMELPVTHKAYLIIEEETELKDAISSLFNTSDMFSLSVTELLFKFKKTELIRRAILDARTLSVLGAIKTLKNSNGEWVTTYQSGDDAAISAILHFDRSTIEEATKLLRGRSLRRSSNTESRMLQRIAFNLMKAKELIPGLGLAISSVSADPSLLEIH